MVLLAHNPAAVSHVDDLSNRPVVSNLEQLFDHSDQARAVTRVLCALALMGLYMDQVKIKGTKGMQRGVRYADLLAQVHKAAGLHYSLSGISPAQSAGRNAVDELRYMTDYGDQSNLHAPDNAGRSPFFCALADDHLEAARFLLQHYVEREAARVRAAAYYLSILTRTV